MEKNQDLIEREVLISAMDYLGEQHQKYVAIEFGNGDYKIASINEEYHEGVAKWYANLTNTSIEENPEGNLEFKILGGGMFMINMGDKKIEIYGESTQYGEDPNREKTLDMLKDDDDPEWDITIKND